MSNGNVTEFHQRRHGEPVDELMALGGQVEEEIRRAVAPMRSSSVPPYVEHDPQVDDVGRLSSEALAASYEASAKRIEAMGESIISEMREVRKTVLSMLKEAERVEQETEEAVRAVAAAAEVYRSQAKELFTHIQRHAMLAAEVRKTAADMTARVRGEQGHG